MYKHLGFMSLLALVASANASAAETMYLAGWGGDVEKLFREKILPPFEAKNNVKVVYVTGNSSDTLAKLQAQQGHQEMSVALIDEGPMSVAVSSNLCGKLEDGPNSKNVYPSARMLGDRSIGLGFYAAGLLYNTAVFKKNGWAPPTSWKDLEDKKYAGKTVIGPITSYGDWVLIMEAKVNGGSETNIDPGFSAMERIAPNVLTWESGPGKLAELYQTGEAAIGVWGNHRVSTLVDQGVPVKFVYPKEGAVAAMNAVCAVEGAPKPQLAQAFIQYILGPDVQTLLAESAGWGPVNKTVKLPPAVAAKVVYGPEQVSKLVKPDYKVLNANRAAWTKRWNRVVER